MPVAVNDVIEALAAPADLPALCRALWIDADEDYLVLIAMMDPPRQPFPVRLSEVESWLRSGVARTVQVKPPAYMLRADLSEAAKSSRDKNWKRIEPLVARDSGIFLPAAMGAMVSARASAIGLPRKTLYRLLYRYWINGQVPDALLPNYEQAGAPGKSREFSSGKRAGPAPKYLGVQQTMEVFQVVEAILPAAKKASQLRACGLRLVGSQAAIQVLLTMADKGDTSAELVVGNLFLQGHPEVVRH